MLWYEACHSLLQSERSERRGEPKRQWGNEDIQPTKGATGIDMGGGGTGTNIEPELPKPKVSEEI